VSDEKLKEINYIIEQSIATLDDSKFLIDNKKFGIAVNRLYYSVFYILSALSLKYNFKTSKHIQLIGWFNKNFINENKLNKEYGKSVHKIFDLRTKADYDFYTHFDEPEVKQMYNEVKVFINDIIKFIKENQ
jgi:uncharacterized protein (UPF0332 family)